MAVNTYFWPFKPNWSSPLTETFKWHTTVFRSRSGYEQRRGLRDGNRRGIEYDFLLKREDAQLLDNLLLKAKAQAFWVPDWQYKCITTADVAVGATVIPGDVTYCPFKAAADIDGDDALGVVLYRDRDIYELFQVSAVTDTQLTLATPTTRAWPKGTTFYPYGKARLMGNVPAKRLTDYVTQGRVSTENYPGERGSYIPWGFYASYVPAYETDHPTTTMNGGEILLTRPNWIGGIDMNYEFVGETLDEDVGAIEQYAVEEFGTVTRPMRWLFKSRQQVHRFKEFLGRRWGRRQSFYMPSWTDDLIVTNAIAATDTTLVCKNTGAGLLMYFPTGAPPFSTDVSRYRIMIRTRTQGDFFRAVKLNSVDTMSIVVGLVEASDFSTPAPLGVTLLPSDIITIHFISAYRFMSDEVSLVWHSDRVAVCETQVMTVGGVPETVPLESGLGVNLTNHTLDLAGAEDGGDVTYSVIIDNEGASLRFTTYKHYDPGSFDELLSLDNGAFSTIALPADEWHAGVPALADYDMRLTVVSGEVPSYDGAVIGADVGDWINLGSDGNFFFELSRTDVPGSVATWQLDIRSAATLVVLDTCTLVINSEALP